jgi:hypothetical protein
LVDQLASTRLSLLISMAITGVAVEKLDIYKNSTILRDGKR